jgi:hypothetical protein
MEDEQCLSQKAERKAKPSQAKPRKKGINPTWLPVVVCTHTTKN